MEFFFFFFKNIISGIQLFIFVHKLRWISSEFFLISDFLAESLKASQKSSWLYKFSKKRVSVSCQEICTAPFLDAQELYSRSTLKANVHILLYISVRKFISKDVVRFFWVGLGLVGGWTISIRRLAVWASQNVLQFFILIEIFGNSTLFQHFNSSIYSTETLKFSGQFWLQG